MNTNQKNMGFWLAWVVASILGFGLGAVLGIAMMFAASVPDSIGFPVFFGVILGTIAGFTQWIVLRRRMADAGLWIPFSALAFMVAVVVTAGSKVSPSNPFLVLAGIYGLLGGFLQGLILQKRGVPIGWWIAASLIGSLLGGALNDSAIDALQRSEAWQPGTMEFFRIWFRIGAPIGLGLGITTGTALVWFLRNARSAPMPNASHQGAQ